MDLSNLQNLMMPIVVVGCLCVGYVIKNTPLFAKVANGYIPLIVCVLGAILGVIIGGVDVESIVYGAVSGLASTGLHQAFTRVLGLDKEGE